VTGLDLVVAMIMAAAGEKLPFDQARASEIRCHAIEFRINAEDPTRNFAPCPGKITSLQLPGGAGVRVDTHIYAGYTVPSYYDSLLAKLIVSAPDRMSAIKRGLRALDELEVGGIHTTAGFHKKVISHPDFQSGKFDTSLVERMQADEEKSRAKDKVAA
jgi:acetyl-CoA carboxylase biotin carboxylase subunit